MFGIFKTSLKFRYCNLWRWFTSVRSEILFLYKNAGIYMLETCLFKQNYFPLKHLLLLQDNFIWFTASGAFSAAPSLIIISGAVKSTLLYFFFFFFWSQHPCCSVAKLCLTLCDPVDCNTPGSSLYHYFPELAQITISSSCPLSW